MKTLLSTLAAIIVASVLIPTPANADWTAVEIDNPNPNLYCSWRIDTAGNMAGPGLMLQRLWNERGHFIMSVNPGTDVDNPLTIYILSLVNNEWMIIKTIQLPKRAKSSDGLVHYEISI